jgi:MFS transporter, DHA1 family, multidrug resistance protein
VFAPLVGGQVLAITSWRGVFVLLAAIGVPLFISKAMWLPETLAPERRHGGGLGFTLRTFGRLFTDRTFMPPAVAFSLAFAAMFAYSIGLFVPGAGRRRGPGRGRRPGWGRQRNETV